MLQGRTCMLCLLISITDSGVLNVRLLYVNAIIFTLIIICIHFTSKKLVCSLRIIRPHSLGCFYDKVCISFLIPKLIVCVSLLFGKHNFYNIISYNIVRSINKGKKFCSICCSCCVTFKNASLLFHRSDAVSFS